MSTSVFGEFEAYVETVQDADLRMVLPRLWKPNWEFSHFSVGSIHIQHGREGSGNITEGAGLLGGQVVFLPLTGRHRANGVAMNANTALVIEPGSEFVIAVHEPHDWCSVFVPFSPADQHSRDDVARGKPTSTRVVTAGSSEMHRLRTVLGSVIAAAQVEPTVLSAPATLHNLQLDLMAACSPVVTSGARVPVPRGRPTLPRTEIMRAVQRYMEQHGDPCVSISELAIASDVTERTLQNAFLDYYGIPPRRYLTTRRMHQARTRLLKSDPNETTVTEIAAHLGFWHFGRFAAEYGRLFAERPSDTLRRSR